MTVYIHHKADGTTSHLQCDDGGCHRVWHTYDVEPCTERQSSGLTLDAATENAIIERAIRTARRSNTTRAPSRKAISMTRSSRTRPLVTLFRRAGDFDADRLFQRGHYPSRPYALDADPDEAISHLRKANAHLSAVRDGQSEFDAERLHRYVKTALDALETVTEDADDPDAEFDNEGRQIPPESAKARDAVGQTSSRSVATTSGQRRDVDHRRDFNSVKQAGADSAHGFDALKLFQKMG